METENQDLTQAVPAENVKSETKKTGMAKFFLFGFLGVVVLVVLLGVLLAYAQIKKLSDNSFVLGVAKVFQVPAAKINGLRIGYTDYIDDLKTMKTFYANPPAGMNVPTPTEEQMSDLVLSRLVANRLIGDLAGDFKLKVEQADYDNFKQELLTNFGGTEEEVITELQKTYGLTMDQYLQSVAKPLILEKKLQETFVSSTDAQYTEFKKEEINARHILFLVNDPKDDAGIKAKAQGVLERVKKGEDFATLAQQFSEDGSRNNGGDLGWFGKGTMVPEFETAVFALETGKFTTNLVKTQYGYHIVKLEGKRTVNDFITFMDKKFREAKIEVLLGIHNPFTDLTTETSGAVTQ